MTDADKTRQRTDSLFGEIALRLRIITEPQLKEALELQQFAKERHPLGLILMRLNFVTQADLERILDAQKAIMARRENRLKAAREDNMFGKVAIRLRLCTEVQVAEGLAIQDRLSPSQFQRLGDILTAKGHLSRQQVKMVLDAQKGLITACPGCNTPYNTVMFQPGASFQCYRCGAAMKAPTGRIPAAREA